MEINESYHTFDQPFRIVVGASNVFTSISDSIWFPRIRQRVVGVREPGIGQTPVKDSILCRLVGVILPWSDRTQYDDILFFVGPSKNRFSPIHTINLSSHIPEIFPPYIFSDRPLFPTLDILIESEPTERSKLT